MKHSERTLSEGEAEVEECGPVRARCILRLHFASLHSAQDARYPSSCKKLLIDGHNLIGQTPGLSLADPNDEQKLIVILRQYAARKQARIVVVFDSGTAARAGGRSKELSGGNVTAIFAGSHTIADRILMERIRELKKSGDWVVVSSDREVQQAALQRKMTVWSSSDFAKRLGAAPQRDASAEPPGPKDSGLTKSEVDEWLRLFKTSRPDRI